MWAANYWTPSYWAPNYWTTIGATFIFVANSPQVVPVVITVLPPIEGAGHGRTYFVPWGRPLVEVRGKIPAPS